MRTFVTTSGVKFMFQHPLDEAPVGSTSPTTIADLLEFTAFLQEEREAIERGPQPVPVRPRLFVNGVGLEIEYRPGMPVGALIYVDKTGRWIWLEEGGTPALAEVPIRTEGTVQAGATVVADATIPYSGEEAQR